MDHERPQECPNCKQRSVAVDFARAQAGNSEVRCARCKIRLHVEFVWHDMAPGHEEHAGYRPLVTRPPKR